MKKTLKVDDSTHKKILILKAWFGYTTIDETLDMILTEYAYDNDNGRLLKEIKKCQ